MQHLNQLSVPTITTVSEGYVRWRASDNRRRYTPDHLQRDTVALLRQHPKSYLCKSLKILLHSTQPVDRVLPAALRDC